MSGCFLFHYDRWHDTDNNTIPRLMGVPVSSTMWVAVFTFVFSSLLNGCIARNTSKTQSLGFYVTSFLWVCLLSVPLMMVHMAVVQMLVGQSLPPQLLSPNVDMLSFTGGLYVLLLCVGIFSSRYVSTKDTLSNATKPSMSAGVRYKAITAGFNFSYLLHLVLILHYSGLLIVARGWMGDSKTQMSTGIHQSVGPCDATAVDYSGLSRQVYLCESNMVHRDYFEFVDITSHATYAETSWYTIRGLPLTEEWTTAVSNTIGGCWVFYLMIDWCLTMLCLAAGESQSEKTDLGKKDH
jgi:hypothetical protein